MTYTRDEVVRRLRNRIANSEPIIGAGAGTGLSAKCEEAGGVDLIVIYNSGRFRMAGRGSLAGCMPYGDANQIVKEMAGEVLTVVNTTPVLAGVCGTDPFRQMPLFLQELQTMGFAGVQNFPTVGLCDGLFRANLEETGMGYASEVDMIRVAHELELFTSPYAFNVDESEQMADAGADIVVAHMGLTTKGSIGGHSARSIDECVAAIQAISDAVHGVNAEAMVLCHGGPISMPDDAAYVLQRTSGVDGFYGASSIERIPVESAIRDQILAFRSIGLSRKAK